ncbi:MAG TPA: SCO family protein, partial [Thermoanaerobaculia bacterium]|nr:SCO family protein [Thermoanaerobaculia bacterium]
MRKLMIFAAAVFLLSTSAVVYMARTKLAAPPFPPAPGPASSADPLQPDEQLAGTRMPEFTLTTQDGQSLTREALLGKITIVDFMFTHCPFICPRLTATMSSMAQQLTGTPIRFLSISVDPIHDTPRQLKQYAADREIDTSRWTLATGDQATLKRIVSDELKFNLEDVPATPVQLPDGSTMSNISHPGH